MMERFLERLAVSDYKNNFIIKGGILVTSMIGVSMRSTMDIDTTIQNFDLNINQATKIINEIIEIELDDCIKFILNDISDIMENREYPGIRISLNAILENMLIPIKIDISTGDVITPREIDYEYPLLLENRSIWLLSYNLETVLAEKMQTILSRGVLNTRMRDFYDVTTLYVQFKDRINYANLLLAFKTTCDKRQTENLLDFSNGIINSISKDISLEKMWKQYCKKYKYASNLQLSSTIDTLAIIINKIKKFKWCLYLIHKI